MTLLLFIGQGVEVGAPVVFTGIADFTAEAIATFEADAIEAFTATGIADFEAIANSMIATPIFLCDINGEWIQDIESAGILTIDGYTKTPRKAKGIDSFEADIHG